MRWAWMQANLAGSIGRQLSYARQQLAHLETARLDAELLLAHTLNVDRTWLIAHHDAPCGESEARRYLDLVMRRAQYEPVAYLTSHRAFWEHDLFIAAGALVPRPETERLVEIALSLDDGQPKVVLDLGTGSGCIALSLASAKPQWDVFAIDIESPALKVAKKNLKSCANAALIQGNWLDALRPDSVDLIVSNPPYIAPTDAHLETLTHEPIRALVAENEGFAAYEAIVPIAARTIKPGGALLFEHGIDQRKRLATLMQMNGFDVQAFDDLARRPRVLMGTQR